MELNTVVIREMLKNLFDDEEFMTFCLDYFPDVRADFSIGMAKTLKINLLIGYCLELNLLDKLVGLIQEERPRQFPSFIKKLYDKSHISSYSNSVKGLVEFETVSPVNLSDLTEAQKYWLSTSIKLALANVLQLAPEEVNILNMRSGSIILSVILPVEVIWLLVNINKQNSTFFSDAIGLRLTFASGYLEPSEEIASQSVNKSEAIPMSEQEAIKAELARREIIEKLHASKSKIITALWMVLKNARRALFLFNKTRYLYRIGFGSLYDKFDILEMRTDTNSQFVKSLSLLEVNFQSWGREIRYISAELSGLIINLDALLTLLQSASTSSSLLKRTFNPLSPFFILGYRKQRGYVDQLIKALEVALENSHKAAKLLAFERAKYYEI